MHLLCQQNKTKVQLASYSRPRELKQPWRRWQERHEFACQNSGFVRFGLEITILRTFRCLSRAFREINIEINIESSYNFTTCGAYSLISGTWVILRSGFIVICDAYGFIIGACFIVFGACFIICCAYYITLGYYFAVIDVSITGKYYFWIIYWVPLLRNSIAIYRVE